MSLISNLIGNINPSAEKFYKTLVVSTFYGKNYVVCVDASLRNI